MWCFCAGHQIQPPYSNYRRHADGLATVVHIVIAVGSLTRLIALSTLGLLFLQITDGVLSSLWRHNYLRLLT